MWAKDKILSRAELLPVVAAWQAAGEQVVFTNGCFDLLHLGHVDYLEKARHLGQRLVVGLNTDASVSRLKPGRPLQDEVSRARILASLLFVDAVVLFDEQTPLALIEAVAARYSGEGRRLCYQRNCGPRSGVTARRPGADRAAGAGLQYHAHRRAHQPVTLSGRPAGEESGGPVRCRSHLYTRFLLPS